MLRRLRRSSVVNSEPDSALGFGFAAPVEFSQTLDARACPATSLKTTLGGAGDRGGPCSDGDLHQERTEHPQGKGIAS